MSQSLSLKSIWHRHRKKFGAAALLYLALEVVAAIVAIWLIGDRLDGKEDAQAEYPSAQLQRGQERRSV